MINISLQCFPFFVSHRDTYIGLVYCKISKQETSHCISLKSQEQLPNSSLVVSSAINNCPSSFIDTPGETLIEHDETLQHVQQYIPNSCSSGENADKAIVWFEVLGWTLAHSIIRHYENIWRAFKEKPGRRSRGVCGFNENRRTNE